MDLKALGRPEPCLTSVLWVFYGKNWVKRQRRPSRIAGLPPPMDGSRKSVDVIFLSRRPRSHVVISSMCDLAVALIAPSGGGRGYPLIPAYVLSVPGGPIAPRDTGV